MKHSTIQRSPRAMYALPHVPTPEEKAARRVGVPCPSCGSRETFKTEEFKDHFDCHECNLYFCKARDYQTGEVHYYPVTLKNSRNFILKSTEEGTEYWERIKYRKMKVRT